MDQPARAPATHFDILGIGNAIVDVLAQVDEGFITRQGMRKGAMNLIDAARAEALYAAMPPAQETSGGSMANTCTAAARLGARVAYLGRVADDQLGAIFRHDIAASGVHFPTPPLIGGAPTARSLICITPDGQRTMNTYLGACVAFGEDEVDEAAVAGAAVVYLEGYLFDPPAAQAAFRRAARIAHAAGRQVALSLSDAWCVERHRPAFRELVRGHVDILFANAAEICALYECEDFAEAVARTRAEVPLAALTRSERGSLIVRGEQAVEVPAAPTQVVDTTGAGDAYAAGFLAALTAGRSLAACGQLGSLAAAEVISHLGARLQRDLRAEAAALG
jgi:sugar/nucleoside kinase (ribokinase family)